MPAIHKLKFKVDYCCLDTVKLRNDVPLRDGASVCWCADVPLSWDDPRNLFFPSRHYQVKNARSSSIQAPILARGNNVNFCVRIAYIPLHSERFCIQHGRARNKPSYLSRTRGLYWPGSSCS